MRGRLGSGPLEESFCDLLDHGGKSMPSRDAEAGGRVVGADEAVGLVNQLLWNTVIIAAPVLIAALLVGLLISVLQVATQLQEMTLSYVPKLLVSALVLIALGPWMIGRITQFAISTIQLIPQLH
jgi:flagellar biosynthetic protein FliQ